MARKKILAFKAVEVLVELRPSPPAWTPGTAPSPSSQAWRGVTWLGPWEQLPVCCLGAGNAGLHPSLQPALRRASEPTLPPQRRQAGSRVRGVSQREMRKRWGPYRTAQWEVSKNMRTLNTGLKASFQPALLFLQPCLHRGPERWSRAGQVTLLVLWQPSPLLLSSWPSGEDCLRAKNTSRDAWEQGRSPLVALFCGSGWEGIKAHALSQEGQAAQMFKGGRNKVGYLLQGSGTELC